MTKDKLLRYGTISQKLCSICNQGHESIDHLFFQCNVSLHIWKTVLNLCFQDYSPQSWNSFIEEKVRLWKHDNLKNIISKLCLGAMVYLIWKERNQICFGKGRSSKEKIIAIIKECVRERASDLSNIEKTKENKGLALNWNLPRCIFK